MLTDLCVYTIKHSRDLEATIKAGGKGTYTERRKWTSAAKLLEAAKREGTCLPILFAPAEETEHLYAWARMECWLSPTWRVAAIFSR